MHGKHFTGLMFNNLSTIEQGDSKITLELYDCHYYFNVKGNYFYST